MRKLTEKERCLIKFKRQELGLTMGSLADELMMSKSNLSRIENGKIMVSKDNMRLLENYFSIDFSLDEDVYQETLNKFQNVVEGLIFYKLFDSYPREMFEAHTNKLISSTAYPVYMLSRLLVYATKNIENYFVEKYLPIFEDLFEYLDDTCKQLLLVAKINYLYFNKQYDKALNLCNNDYFLYEPNTLYDSFVIHIQSILYSCINNQVASYETAETAIGLSEKLNNFQRLISLNILKTCNLRLMHKYIDALLGDLNTLSYALKYDIHHYDYTIYCNIAWSYYLLGNYKLATKYYSLAEQIDMDDDICFYSALSYWRLGNRKKCKEYILKGRRAKNVGIAMPYLLDWLELTLNKKYSLRAEKRLLYCLKKFEDVMRAGSKNCIYQLLIEHYNYLGNKDLSSLYYEKYESENFFKIKRSIDRSEDVLIKN